MGCAQSTKSSKSAVKKQKNNNISSQRQQKVDNITNEFVQKAKNQGVSVEQIVFSGQNDPQSSELPTNICRPKFQSHPILQNIEILHKHLYPKLKPLSCNNLFKNRQSLGLSVHDQRSTIASLCPHKCAMYFNDNQQNEIPSDPMQV